MSNYLEKVNIDSIDLEVPDSGNTSGFLNKDSVIELSNNLNLAYVCAKNITSENSIDIDYWRSSSSGSGASAGFLTITKDSAFLENFYLIKLYDNFYVTI